MVRIAKRAPISPLLLAWRARSRANDVAGFFLAEFIASNSDIFKDKRVVELGSGIGFTGCVLMKAARPRHTILTDYLDSVLLNLECNVECNFSAQTTSTCPSYELQQVDWEATDVTTLNFDCDLVIAADVVRFSFYCFT